jgi:23S rRNA pseudouridine2605 synthase
MVEERVQKILARAGFGSRRSCEDLITTGRVTVNGKAVLLGEKADAESDTITVDGKTLPTELQLRYIAYYKPRFVLCDKVYDEDTRRTVFNMVEGASDLAVVGRLDYESEGLVILTNDGDMVNKLTHPRYQHEKEYRVLVATHPDVKQMEIWRRGVVLEDGHRTSPASVTVEGTAGKGTWIRVILKEGHKRQIRETAKLTGLFVVKLVRTRIATLRLGKLKTGDYRSLTSEEIGALKDTSRPPRLLKTPRRVGATRSHTKTDPEEATKRNDFSKPRPSSRAPRSTNGSSERPTGSKPTGTRPSSARPSASRPSGSRSTRSTTSTYSSGSRKTDSFSPEEKSTYNDGKRSNSGKPGAAGNRSPRRPTGSGSRPPRTSSRGASGNSAHSTGTRSTTVRSPRRTTKKDEQ